MGKPGWEDSMLYFQANTASYAGQFAKARDLMRRASNSAQRADEKETAATYQAISGVHDALAGNLEPAKQQAQSALEAFSGRDVQALAAVAFALAGDSRRATRLAAILSQRYPEDTTVQFDYLPVIYAARALQSGNPAKAVAALGSAAPYELGRAPLVWVYPVYLRGTAYLAQGEGTAAAAEFQTILNHPGVVLNEPIGALAHLGIARAYAMVGDTAKGKAAYQDFFALWKDADPDVPIYEQAKEEFAKIR
jgi:ATP/maltotriose-dependent transcriptional regulator MalT